LTNQHYLGFGVTLINSLCLRRELVLASGGAFIEHVYSRILGREPEFDAAEVASNSFCGAPVSDRCRYLLSILTSVESLSREPDDYEHLLLRLLEGLGYSVAVKVLVEHLRELYPTRAVLLAELTTLFAAIEDNTWFAQTRVEERGGAASELDFTLLVHGLTEAVNRLTVAHFQLKDDLTELSRALAQTNAKIANFPTGGSLSESGEILALLSAVLAEISGARD
jgi:hypothetical protein